VRNRLTRARKPRHTLTSIRGARFHCAGCNADFRGYRAMNAHHAAKHAGRWASKAARGAQRKMGKETDNLRRHAMGWLESSNLRQWVKVPIRGKDGKEVVRNGRTMTRDVPVKTARADSRPSVGGHVSARQLRQLHKHDTHHESARTRRIKAAGHTARIARGARTPVGKLAHRVRRSRAETHVRKADGLEARWQPVKAPAARPAPVPRATPSPNGNGRTPRASNGSRPARTGPTRSPRS
jgi:hypothetical protein